MYHLLISPYTVGIVIPLLLLFSSFFIKKLVRGSNWQKEDFYLGVELSLATVTSNLVYFYDLAKEVVITTNPSIVLYSKLTASTSFICVTFFILFLIMSLHQDWQHQNADPRGQWLRLGILSNIMGCSLLFLFIAVIKGVS